LLCLNLCLFGGPLGLFELPSSLEYGIPSKLPILLKRGRVFVAGNQAGRLRIDAGSHQTGSHSPAQTVELPACQPSGVGRLNPCAPEILEALAIPANENTNLLLRQYFPRGTDLSGYSQAQLDQVALRLNQRPRKTLGFQTPASKLQASVASTV